MKIVIAGFGKVGETLTTQLLEEEHDVTLIDKNPDIIENALERYDVMAICGNCAFADILNQAEVGDADLFIAVSNSDEINLLACATAHGINPNINTVGRVRDPEYFVQSFSLRDIFGMSLVVNPECQAALQIEKLIKFPGYLKRESFAHGRAELAELRIEAGSMLDNLVLKELPAKLGCQVLVSVVIRDGQAGIPNGSWTLKPDDRILISASTDELVKLLKVLGISDRKTNRVVICGGGPVSFYLAKRLEKSDIKVTVIEKDESRCDELVEALTKADIILGDAGEKAVLDSIHIESADAIVAATGMDELNIILALCAKENKVSRVFTKIDHINVSSALDVLPLGTVISPREICGSLIAKHVRALRFKKGAAKAVYKIADGSVEALEFIADEETLHTGEKLRNLQLRPNVLVSCIVHGQKVSIANGDSAIERGDAVIIISKDEHKIYRLNDIFA